MKTIIVWDWYGMDMVQFGVVDGDYRHLDGTYINMADGDEEKRDELDRISESEGFSLCDIFPLDIIKENPDEVVVIVCGFIP